MPRLEVFKNVTEFEVFNRADCVTEFEVFNRVLKLEVFICVLKLEVFNRADFVGKDTTQFLRRGRKEIRQAHISPRIVIEKSLRHASSFISNCVKSRRKRLTMLLVCDSIVHNKTLLPS